MKNRYFFSLTAVLFVLSHCSISAQEMFPQKKGKHYVYVDETGDKMFKQKFDAARRFSEGFAAVSVDDKWGFINDEGIFVIPPLYGKVSDFSNQLALVEKGKTYFIINPKRESVSAPYDSMYQINNLYVTKKDSLYGLIDSAGVVFKEPQYKAVGFFYNNTLTIHSKGKWGVLENGQENFDQPRLYFSTPEQRPIFSKECETIKDEKESKACSDKAMSMSLYRNISYPPNARENGIEGTVVVRFVIDEKGQAVDHELVKSIGGGCDEEAFRVVQEHLTQWYQPGYQDGLPVNTVFNLPIRFRLE